MSKTQITILADHLWRALELMQRVNMLTEVDREEFEENNLRCNRIKSVLHSLNEADSRSIKEARKLAAEYLNIFSDDEEVQKVVSTDE